MQPKSMMANIMSLSTQSKEKKKSSLTIFEMTLFAMLGSIMYCSKLLMSLLPNIHLLGMLIMTFTVVFRKKALIPIYVYVLLEGVFAGFSMWWIPYLYVWTILWGATMLLPKNMPKKIACFVYPVVCCLHGLLFGTLYAPVQALIYGLDFKQTLAWIAAGFTFDVIHGISNLFAGMLIVPLSALMRKLLKMKMN